jgi:hypothetical protein
MLVVHLALADVANDMNDNRLWLKRADLARKARCSERTVTRTLAALVETGYLEALSSTTGRGRTPEYRLLRPKAGQSVTLSGEAKGGHEERERVTTATVKGDNGDNALLLTKDNPSNPTLAPNGAAAKPTDDPLTRAAHRLTILAFEQPEKPDLARANGNVFPAVMKLIERALRKGRSVPDVERAIKAGDITWTVAGLQTAISKARPRSGTSGASGVADRLVSRYRPEEAR